MTTAWAIETDALSRDFDGHRALSELTLRVPEGIIFGLLGPNGAGKTTTLRLLLGLLERSSGEARVLGFDPGTRGDAVRNATGVLLEHTGLYERLTVEDNLEFYGRAWRLPRARRQARIAELLTHLGLWERRRDTVATWSRGMRQKLGLARAMLHSPMLLLLDEPTAGLDPVAAAALRADLATLVAREGVTVLLTTHNLLEAESLCAQIAVLRDGHLLAVGTPREIRTAGQRARVEIVGRRFEPRLVAAIAAHAGVALVRVVEAGTLLEITLRPEADVAPLVALLVSLGAEVEEVRRGPQTLEDAFRLLVEEAR